MTAASPASDNRIENVWELVDWQGEAWIKVGMWTQASRGRMADFEKRVRRYPTDLTDEEWALIVPFLPPAAARGRKPATDRRDVLDALRYLARTGGG